MKKGWTIFIKILDAISWLWSKIRPNLPSDNKNTTNP